MKKHKGILSIGTTLILLAMVAISCEKRNSSELTAEEAIYQDYFVTFDMTAKKTIAAASLRDKNRVRLVLTRKGEGILFNKQQPTQAKTLSNAIADAFVAAITDYEYKWEVNKLVDGEFTYMKNKSKSFKNSIQLKEAVNIEIPDGFKEIKLDGTTVLKWEGMAVGNKENVAVSIQQKGNDQAGGTGTVSEEGAKEIKVDGLLIKDLKKGKAVLTLTRRKQLAGLAQSDGKKNNGRRIVEVLVTKEVTVK